MEAPTPTSFPLVQMDAPTPKLTDSGVEASLAYPLAVDLVFIIKKLNAWYHLNSIFSLFWLLILNLRLTLHQRIVPCVPLKKMKSRCHSVYLVRLCGHWLGNVSREGEEWRVTYVDAMMFKSGKTDAEHTQCFLVAVTKDLTNQREGRKGLLWLTVSERLQPMPQQRSWRWVAQCSQEARRDANWCLAGFLLPLLFSPGPWPIGGCHSYLGWVFSSGSLETSWYLILLSLLLLWWRKHLCHLTLVGHSSSLRKVRADTQSGDWRRNCGGMITHQQAQA